METLRNLSKIPHPNSKSKYCLNSLFQLFDYTHKTRPCSHFKKQHFYKQFERLTKMAPLLSPFVTPKKPSQK